MTINPHDLDLSGTNLVLESILHKGTASTIYKCNPSHLKMSWKLLGMTNDSKKTLMCVRKVRLSLIFSFLRL